MDFSGEDRQIKLAKSKLRKEQIRIQTKIEAANCSLVYKAKENQTEHEIQTEKARLARKFFVSHYNRKYSDKDDRRKPRQIIIDYDFALQ